MTYTTLDQPVWHALSETHQTLAYDFSGAKCYDPAYCPFGAWTDVPSLPEALDRYAQQLIAHTTQQIFTEGKIPFLHVAASNIPAIRLYEKLGFHVRREISFWQLKHA